LNFSVPDDFFATTITFPATPTPQQMASNAAGFKVV
jgi:hypothetical protein